MLKIKVDQSTSSIKMKGFSSEILAELVVATDSTINSLANQTGIPKTILLCMYKESLNLIKEN